MTTPDVATLQRRIDHAIHAATRIRQQLADLHTTAWEPTTATTEPGNRVSGGQQDHSPRSGPPIAKHLWNRTQTELARIEDVIVGLERAITGYFMVTAILEPTRGSLIHAAEHDRLLAKQRARQAAGQYTPATLIDQPGHPGKHRPT